MKLLPDVGRRNNDTSSLQGLIRTHLTLIFLRLQKIHLLTQIFLRRTQQGGSNNDSDMKKLLLTVSFISFMNYLWLTFAIHLLRFRDYFKSI